MPAPKRNALLIIADDHQADAVAALGHQVGKTSTLDRLVASGTSFLAASTIGGLIPAVYSKSRACLFTARNMFRSCIRPDISGSKHAIVTIAEDVMTLPQCFRAAGYENFITGKLHNDVASLLRSFEYGREIFHGGMSEHKRRTDPLLAWFLSETTAIRPFLRTTFRRSFSTIPATLALLFSAAAGAAATETPRDEPRPGAVNAHLLPDGKSRRILFIAGDSTAAKNDGNPFQGWGESLAKHFDETKLLVINRARGGCSSRTFVNEGDWDRLINCVMPRDIVLIQFGNNDAGPVNGEWLEPGGRLRSVGSLPGIGDEQRTIRNVIMDKSETVRTYGWYMRKMIADVYSRQGIPIVLSLTIRNIWVDNRVERRAATYDAWAACVTQETGTPFLRIGDDLADAYEKLGQLRVTTYFPRDHVHTNQDGAEFTAGFIADALRRLPADTLAPNCFKTHIKTP